MSEIKVKKGNGSYLRPMSLKDIASSLSNSAFELSDDTEIKIGSFRKTKKELKRVLEDELEYQEIYEQWFPGEKITPEALSEAPTKIMKEFVLASVADFAVELENEPVANRSVGTGIKNYFRSMLLRFEIDSIELRAYLEGMRVTSKFIERFLAWIYL
jgi:hypothetical protein